MMYSKLSVPFQNRLNQDNSCPSENSSTWGSQNDEIIPSCKGGLSSTLSTGVYSSYEDLPDYFKDSLDFSTLFLENLGVAKEEDDWKIQFDVIENLRILNKFHAKEVGKYIHLFPSFLQRCIDNPRTNLSKNTLLLIKEIFLHFREVQPNEEMLFIILPKVLEKGTSEKNFLKTEARSALKVLEKTGCCDAVIRILCEKTFDKSANISELSFQTLAESVKEAKENLSGNVSQSYLELLFSTIAKTIDGKRAASKRLAEELCQQLKGFLPVGEGDVEGYLKNNLKTTDYEARLIVKAMQNQKKTVIKNDFSSFLKERKLKKELSYKEENKIDESNRNVFESDEI